MTEALKKLEEKMKGKKQKKDPKTILGLVVDLMANRRRPLIEYAWKMAILKQELHQRELRNPHKPKRKPTAPSYVV